MADEVGVALDARGALNDGTIAGAVGVGEDGVIVGVCVGVEVRVTLCDGEMTGAVVGGEDGVVVHVGVGLARSVVSAKCSDSSEGNGVADMDAGGVNEGLEAGEEELVANTEAVEEDWVPGTFEVGLVGAKGNGIADENVGGVSVDCDAVGYVLVANT